MASRGHMADSAYLGMGGESDDTLAGRLTITLADLARSVVAKEAPEQVELLAVVTAQWEAGNVPGRRRWDWMSGSVNFGIDPTVLSEFIYPLLVGTFAEVLGDVTLTRLRRWRRSRLRSVPRTQVTLSADQIDDVHPVCIVYGMTLGLSEIEARVLADALCGALRRTLEESWRQR